MIPRPTTTAGSLCSTPSAACSVSLLGGHRYEGVTFSRDEFRALERLYEFDLAGEAERARTHTAKAHADAVAQQEAEQAKRDPWSRQPAPIPPPDLAGAARWQTGGDSRNLMRHAEADGLRMVAAIARALQPGEDPVRLLLSLMAQAGFDVAEDPEWCDGDGSGGGEEEP